MWRIRIPTSYHGPCPKETWSTILGIALRTFANYEEYSISLQLISFYMMCKKLMLIPIYSLLMYNYISQYWLCPNLHGLLEPILRSKEALQIQVRMILFLVLGPLVCSIVSKYNKCLNSNCQYFRLIANLDLNVVSEVYLILVLTVGKQPYMGSIYSDLSILYLSYIIRTYCALSWLGYRQPHFNYIYLDLSRHD